LLKTGQPDAAREVLARAVRNQPGDPDLHKLLATAAGEAGKKLEAHRSLAEYYYLNGNPKAAIDQLQIAARYAGDSFYAHSSLEARIKEIKDEVTLYTGKDIERER
jgi:predicted Zn-dependent protease